MSQPLRENRWAYGALCVVFTTGMTAIMTDQYGILMGIVAGLVEGALLLPSVISNVRTVTWLRRHPWALGPMSMAGFVLVAMAVPIGPPVYSVAVGCGAGAVLGVVFFLAHRTDRTEPMDIK
ncbi:hypothetical protein [Nonomuraea rhizosphaerae]|uniref:hypothetical protein n=1 Tax=Nonomuraea rhizosphaerae TaxID=2665663 RepID=UPI001C5E9126|nr:hypothetical protein [Nonomuraea rhizosphaerae]